MRCFLSALLISILATSFSFRYEATPMEDPLQPIWDRLESLSNEILDGFQKQMTKFVTETQANIDSKFQDLKANMSSMGAGGRRGDDSALVNDVTDAVSDWIEQFYMNDISTNNHDLVKKAEGGIKVRLEALENKLIEHINVKIAALTSSQASGQNATSVVPAGPQFRDLETKITNHITTKLSDIEDSVSSKLENVSQAMSLSSSKLSFISTHVTKVVEKLSDLGISSAESDATSTGESCAALVNKVGSLVNNSLLSNDFLEQQEIRWKEMQSVMADVRETHSYLPRDCSDIHWLHHEAQSGVYQIYPSLDNKNSLFAHCNMGQSGDKTDGGWTVILRRTESDFGHVEFNRTWEDYAKGFGDPAEGEWWFSLTALHTLTYRQPYEILFQLTDIEDGHYYASYKTFRVEDEAHNFRLIVDGFDGNVTLDAFKSKHHGMSFSTPDRDNDNYADGSCALLNAGGWWFNACHYTALTSPFPTSSDRSERTIRWMSESGKWMVLNDVTVMIRPSNYGTSFDVHGYEK